MQQTQQQTQQLSMIQKHVEFINYIHRCRRNVYAIVYQCRQQVSASHALPDSLNLQALSAHHALIIASSALHLVIAANVMISIYSMLLLRLASQLVQLIRLTIMEYASAISSMFVTRKASVKHVQMEQSKQIINALLALNVASNVAHQISVLNVKVDFN